MSFELDRVRLTIGERNLLSRLKNPTGIDNWNIFARWAFCYSIGKASEINLNEEDGEYGVEMSWVVFSGKNYKLYQDLLIQECNKLELIIKKFLGFVRTDSKDRLLYALKIDQISRI